jgi:hypothetical protein
MEREKMARKAKTAQAPEAVEVVSSIKALDHEFKCRDHQFEVGKTYTVEGEIVAYRNGFHAVDWNDPFHVWDFYPIIDDEGRLTRYAETDQTGAMAREEEKRGTKIASASITIKAELTLPEFVKKAVARVVEMTKGKGDDPSGYYARIGSSGYSAQIGSSGYSAQIGSSGYYARIGSSGHYARIGSSGHYARIGSSGDSAQIGSSGDYAQIGSSGYSARIGSSGHYARIGSSGHYARIGSSGYYARIGSSGHYARIGSSGYSAQIGSSGYSAQIGSSGDSAQIGSSGDYAQIGSSGYSAQIGSSGYSARIDASGENNVVASAGINARVKGAIGTWISVAEFDDSIPPKCIGFATGCIGQDGLKPDIQYIAKGGKLVRAD